MTDPLSLIRAAVALIATATLVAALARRAALPDSVVLVLAGLLGADLFPEIAPAVTPSLVLGVFVPGVIFAAAYSIDWTDLRPVLGPIVSLAIPGVLASAVVVAFALNLGMGLPLELAFVVGAITAATDPVAVVATMRRLDVPRGLRTLVEGESLLNDGTGLVLFALAVRAVEVGLGTGESVVLFVGTIVVSAAVGVAGGLFGARVIGATEERTIQLGISIVVAYGAYQLADVIGLSGILATVIAGIALGSRMRRTAGSEAVVREMEHLWEVVAFILTSLVFLLIGFAVRLPPLLEAAAAVAVGTGAVLAGRALIVYLPTAAVRLWSPAEAFPRGWVHVIFWSGLRGAIALAAALSLPTDFPQRELLQQVSFGIVLVTLIVLGSGAPLVVRRALRGGDGSTALRSSGGG
ncbi:MAG TPA: sodium:proton antiporter [Candidatus Bathyarchaeia archaeon]|nr:sodium:proton antiporter [Candidatus Bathyarchaeia archaeon]